MSIITYVKSFCKVFCAIVLNRGILLIEITLLNIFLAPRQNRGRALCLPTRVTTKISPNILRRYQKILAFFRQQKTAGLVWASRLLYGEKADFAVIDYWAGQLCF